MRRHKQKPAPWPSKPSRPLSSRFVVAVQRAAVELQGALDVFARRVRRARADGVPDEVYAVKVRLRGFHVRLHRVSDAEVHVQLFLGDMATSSSVALLPAARNVMKDWVATFRMRPRCKRSRDRRRLERAFDAFEAAAAALDKQVRARETMDRLGRTEFFADSRLPSW